VVGLFVQLPVEQDSVCAAVAVPVIDGGESVAGVLVGALGALAIGALGASATVNGSQVLVEGW
jgi:hypothetical protein